MKNQAFIATLLLYPAEEVQAMLSAKEGRTLPADLSHLAKFLIGQGGQKKEDIFRSTGLSRDYLYKVLRGVKNVKERDYILAICLSAHLDLVDAAIMLDAYHLDALSIGNERDVLLIHALSHKLGMEDTNRLLTTAGLHTVRVSPKASAEDHMNAMIRDIKITRMQIAYTADNGWNIQVTAEVPAENKSIHYTQAGTDRKMSYQENEQNLSISDTDLSMDRVLFCYLESMIWQEIWKQLEIFGNHEAKDSFICAVPGTAPHILSEVAFGSYFYQLIRESNGCTTYLRSDCSKMAYFFLRFFTGSDMLYHALYGTRENNTFSIYGCDLDELPGAEDQDIALFLRMKREMKLWRAEHGYLHASAAEPALQNVPGKEEREQIRKEAKTHTNAEAPVQVIVSFPEYQVRVPLAQEERRSLKETSF